MTNLNIADPIVKDEFFKLLKDKAKIPVCLNCGKLFKLGFPNTDNGLCDYLICKQNNMLCTCEYDKIVTNLYKAKKDGVIDTAPYYR